MLPINPDKPWLFIGAAYVDYLEITFKYHPEPVRCIDGSTRPKGWSYDYQGLHRKVSCWGLECYPTLIKAIEAAAKSYCSGRDNDAWREWHEQWTLVHFLAKRIQTEAHLKALERHVGTDLNHREDLFESTSLPQLVSRMTLLRWLEVTPLIRQCWSTWATAKEKTL